MKDNGLRAIENLMQKKGKFDYILLETTGLADPGAVASMFWVDAELGSDIYLDGIITIVDSKYGLKHLTEEKPDGLINEATRQVALADIILINKTDLVPEEDVKKLRMTIRSINGLGQILETQRSRVDLSNVLDLHAFDSLSGISLQKNFSMRQEYNLTLIRVLSQSHLKYQEMQRKNILIYLFRISCGKRM